MTKILFICHGNICRSAAAEMVMWKMVEDRGLEQLFQIGSAATSREEIGNDVYPPMKKALAAAGYPCRAHAARQVTRGEYDRWDQIIGMDDENMFNLRRLFGTDPEGKLSMLMDWAGEKGQEIDDPWYTRDFHGSLKQIEKGCRGLLDALHPGKEKSQKIAADAADTKVAVLSDTHGLLRREVVAELQDCTHILHAGDIIREMDLDELRLYGNIYAVRGNNDIWQEGLRDLAGVLRFEIAGVSFLMTHDRRDVPRNLEGVQVVVCGHTHQYSEEWVDGRLWLNPGSCGRARWGGEVTMAKLCLRAGKIISVRKIILA